MHLTIVLSEVRRAAAACSARPTLQSTEEPMLYCSGFRVVHKRSIVTLAEKCFKGQPCLQDLQTRQAQKKSVKSRFFRIRALHSSGCQSTRFRQLSRHAGFADLWQTSHCGLAPGRVTARADHGLHEALEIKGLVNDSLK